MSNERNPKELLSHMMNRISEVMAIMNNFEDSRPGEKAFTHLEEGLMWLQLLCHNVQLKPLNEIENEEKIIMPVIDTEE